MLNLPRPFYFSDLFLRHIFLCSCPLISHSDTLVFYWIFLPVSAFYYEKFIVIFLFMLFAFFYSFLSQPNHEIRLKKVPFCWKAKIDKGANDNIPSVCADDIDDVTVKNKSFSFSAFLPNPPSSDPEIRKKNRTEFLLAFSFPTHKGKQITITVFWKFSFSF